ncbi:VOC family protein [Paenibacillus elgii]|uniref:VOC family protein n=1 Tax=Paenibacillus elgii TaxID=189691 RepID=UPI000248C3EF|nr:VOC family protein [Paenibacillus elgii]
MKIHHIGYAVNIIEEAGAHFINLGYQISTQQFVDNKRNVIIQFFNNGHSTVELIAPLNELSPINNILRKIGNSPYHICYETSNIEQTIALLKSNNYILIEPPSEAVALENHLVAFMFHKFVGLIELLEIRSAN